MIQIQCTYYHTIGYTDVYFTHDILFLKKTTHYDEFPFLLLLLLYDKEAPPPIIHPHRPRVVLHLAPDLMMVLERRMHRS